MENGFGSRGGNMNGINSSGQYGNSNSNLNLNEFRQVIQALQSLEKYRSEYEDLIIAKYSNYSVSKSNPSSNTGVKALGFKIFSKIHKLNVAYLSKIQSFFPKLYEIIFQDQLALNSSFKESATSLIAAPGLSLGKIFAQVAKGGRQRLQKELTKLQNYTTQYPNLAQERNKNNKNERFYSDKHLQGIDSFIYIIGLQKKYYLRQQLPYKTLLTSKKAKGMNQINAGNISGGVGGPNVYDEIMNIEKKKGNEGSGNGVQNSSQNLHFSKEYESIFEMITSNYDKYMKDYMQSNKYIGIKIRQYTQNVVKAKPINKRHPLYNNINHKNQEKEDQNRIKYLQQTGQLNNNNNLLNVPQQQQQSRVFGSSSNLDRQTPQSTIDLSSRNNQTKQSPQKNFHRPFQSIALTQANIDSQQLNQNRTKFQEQIQQNKQNQFQIQTQNSNNNLGKNVNSFMTIKKFQVPTAPIFLSNTLSLNNHSSQSNRDVSEDFSTQMNQQEDILTNNGLPSYIEYNINNNEINKNQEDAKIQQALNSQTFSKQNNFRGENSSIDQVFQSHLHKDVANNKPFQKRASKYMKTENQSTLDSVEQLFASQQNNQQRKSINNNQPYSYITNLIPINEPLNKQMIPSQMSLGIFNDDSSKNSQNLLNSQNTFVELQQPEQKISTKTPTHFNSLNSLDFQPQQKDFLVVTQVAPQHQSHSMIPNYRSQLPLAGSIVLKKSKQLNQQEIQQVNKNAQGQIQQPNIFSSTATLGQQRLLQQQNAQKRGSGLSGQNAPQLLGNNLIGFPFQALLMNNNTSNVVSSTKNNFKYQQFGQQNQSDINPIGRQSINFPLTQQQLNSGESTNNSQFYSEEYNFNVSNQSGLNSNQQKFGNGNKISSTNQLLMQSQQFSSMVQNNILSQQMQIQQDQMQRDSLQQKYQQQQQQQQQNQLQKQQQSNPSQAAYYMNPNPSIDYQNTSQGQLQKKQTLQTQQNTIPTNSSQNIAGSQVFNLQFPSIGSQKQELEQEQYPAQSQNTRLHQAQSLQKIPSTSNILVPISQQQGNTNKLSQSNKTFHQAQNINQNNMNQKYIPQDFSLKKLRNSLSTNPKQITSNLLSSYGQSTLIKSSKKSVEYSKKHLMMAYNLNGTNTINYPTQADDNINEENIRSNLLEKRDFNSANKALYRNSEGNNDQNDQPNTTRNYTQEQSEEDILQDQDNYYSNDPYSKASTNQLKNFVISPPRKMTNNTGQKSSNEFELISQQNQSLFVKKPSLSDIQTTPAVMQTQMS